MLNSDRFADRAPASIHATLLDEGCYLGSVRTMYRLLASCDAVREPGLSARDIGEQDALDEGYDGGAKVGEGKSGRRLARDR